MDLRLYGTLPRQPMGSTPNVRDGDSVKYAPPRWLFASIWQKHRGSRPPLGWIGRHAGADVSLADVRPPQPTSEIT